MTWPEVGRKTLLRVPRGSWKEAVGDRSDQKTLYICRKFSQNKYKYNFLNDTAACGSTCLNPSSQEPETR